MIDPTIDPLGAVREEAETLEEWGVSTTALPPTRQDLCDMAARLLVASRELSGIIGGKAAAIISDAVATVRSAADDLDALAARFDGKQR